MSIRTKLLSWRNINTDSDFSKYIETVSEPWVIEWLQVSTNSVAVWKCWVPCERTNWETIYSLVENFSALTIDTSWTWYVIVEIGQTYIDDWSLINEDWTWVATIKVVSELPTKNYLELASISSWTITDTRNMIKKVWELDTEIKTLTSFVDDIDERVEALEEAAAMDHLEEIWIVWEKYLLWDELFNQNTPNYNDSTVEANVGDISDNTEIHIQRQGSWVASNELKLKVKMAWSPTTSLVVEVRKWIKVNAWDKEAYWYWDSENIIWTATIPYTSFSSDWNEITVELDNEFWWTEWELLDIVLYQSNWTTVIVNDTNYFVIACDSTQTSEAFSYVSVNWNSRTRSKDMPYCVSTWFLGVVLCKAFEMVDWYSNTVYASWPFTKTLDNSQKQTSGWWVLEENIYENNTSYTQKVKLAANPSSTFPYQSNSEWYAFEIVWGSAGWSGSISVQRSGASWEITLNPWYHIRLRYRQSYTSSWSCTPNISNIQFMTSPTKVYYDYAPIRLLPMEEKDLWLKAKCNLFWMTDDNSFYTPYDKDKEAFERNTVSWGLDFVKKQWTAHTGNANDIDYTMKGYWYIRISVYCYASWATSYNWRLTVNWTIIAQGVSVNNWAFSWLYFLKPWDVVNVHYNATFCVYELKDYYLG